MKVVELVIQYRCSFTRNLIAPAELSNTALFLCWVSTFCGAYLLQVNSPVNPLSSKQQLYRRIEVFSRGNSTYDTRLCVPYTRSCIATVLIAQVWGGACDHTPRVPQPITSGHIALTSRIGQGQVASLRASVLSIINCGGRQTTGSQRVAQPTGRRLFIRVVCCVEGGLYQTVTAVVVRPTRRHLHCQLDAPY